MAETTIEGLAAGSKNGQSRTIEVENPATGKVIASVPVVAPDQVAALVARARRAQPGWEALGFDGRAARPEALPEVGLDNSERVIETIVSETGKAYEDAQLAEIGYAAAAFGFWAKNARSTWPRSGSSRPRRS